jgi:CheY-like chemotaxis protein
MVTPTVPERRFALLVDDHPDVLVTTGVFLKAAGFDVVRVVCGDEALACIAAGGRFALLVADYGMPGMNGIDLAMLALEHLPDLKVMIITGLPGAIRLSELPQGAVLLVKPFRRATLIENLESLFSLVPGSLQPLSNAATKITKTPGRGSPTRRISRQRDDEDERSATPG